MDRVEKTAFISYRRDTGSGWALAISRELTRHEYNVFLDFTGIGSGDFEQVILENIKARDHFLVLLTPSALERVDDPSDWLRREIETALEHRRNIVPVMLEGFDFATPSIGTHLTGTLAPLKSYNGLSVPLEYFDAAMDRLMTKHLNVALSQVRHPASLLASEAAKTQQMAAQAAPPVTVEALTAEWWFERGFDAANLETKILFYSEAIRLRPDDSQAFFNRGVARGNTGDLDGAVADYTEAIRLNSDYHTALFNRGLARGSKGDSDGAVADFTEAIRLRPDNCEAFFNRGVARGHKRDWDGALADFTDTIRSKPDYYVALFNRGAVRDIKGDLDGAVADYTEAIRLKPDDPDPFHNRGSLRAVQGDDAGAVADFKKYLELGGNNEAARAAAIETIRKIESKNT